MPAPLSSAVDRLGKAVGEMSLAQRVFSVLMAAAIILGAIAVGSWATQPTMSPLYTGLSQADAAAIVDHLNAQGIEYELAAGGSTVMVPNDALYSQRISVAAAGLPASSDGGYSLLDGMSMTSSEFQQQVTYQRALEGELARTISAIDGVEAASVRLALPEESIFVAETPAPTASVFVQTRAGASLSSSQVQAIIHLVSAGIEGMSPHDVAVIDADGTVLSTVGGQSSELMQAGQTSDYEQRIAANVQAMLDRVVGPGNAVVSVSADLDYDAVARVTETFTSDDTALPLSESISTESYTGGAATDAGVLGPDNIAVPAEADGEAGAYSKESVVRNNAVNKVTETVETAGGTVRRQSVSVVVSEEAAAGLDLAELETMVMTAAGVDEARGDMVSVSRMAFDTTVAEEAQTELAVAMEAQAAEAQQTMYIEISKWGSIGLIVIVAMLLMFISARRRRRDRRTTLSLEAVEELEARTESALEARARAVIEKAQNAATGDPVAALDAAPVPTMEAVTSTVRDEIMAFASEQPAEVAEVLRGWLSSGRR